jgi:hypothetical protein
MVRVLYQDIYIGTISLYPKMTLITPGTTGTLQSTSAEAALVEILTFIRNNERLSAKNPSSRRYVNVDYNLNTGFVVLSWTIPSRVNITGTGSIETSADNYLTDVSFFSGTGGTFKSTGYTQSILEIAEFLQLAEQDSSKNPNDLNYIQSNYDSDTKNYSGNAQIPFNVEIDNGFPKIVVVPYLS